MGQISDKLIKRLRKSRKLVAELRQEAEAIRTALDALKRGEAIRIAPGVALDPLHAVYVAVQNATSVFAERVSVLPEFKPYYQLAAKAEDDYLPQGPPMSPLTRSYFTSWAFFDLRFGPDRETIGTCLLDVGQALGFEPGVVDVIRTSSGSRMGIYEHVGSKGDRTLLKELITGDEFESHVASGYRGRAGELWFVRACPPIGALDYHVVVTTPYILTGFGKADWTAYLSKSLIGLTGPEKRRRLHELLKYGREPNQWPEFIFRAYHHHQFDAIFLTGLPDVPGSLPHA
jgi:hypothetical protein